jgi:hypothetical protein
MKSYYKPREDVMSPDGYTPPKYNPYDLAIYCQLDRDASRLFLHYPLILEAAYPDKWSKRQLLYTAFQIPQYVNEGLYKFSVKLAVRKAKNQFSNFSV